MFIKRNISEELDCAINRSPVVFLAGARQSGKSTLLAKHCKNRGYEFISFDDLTMLATAQNDLVSFFAGIKKPTVIDEVQRIPDLFLAIKYYVDRKRVSGTFVLTGSANPMLIPKLSDSLAGRMEIITLYPFSQGEIQGNKETFIEKIFAQNFAEIEATHLELQEIKQKIVIGGYPLAINKSHRDRNMWFNSYLTTILQRDIKDIADIEGITTLPNLLKLLASRCSNLLNNAEISRASGIPASTLKRYMILLEILYLIIPVQPWSSNLSKRLVKSPKIYLVDSGLLIHLLGGNIDDQHIAGQAFENFVVTELLKQITWSKKECSLYHYRTESGYEIDSILEDKQGNIVGIESKNKALLSSTDIKGLRHLQEKLGDKFKAGIVIYSGKHKLCLGENIWAVPISALFS